MQATPSETLNIKDILETHNSTFESGNRMECVQSKQLHHSIVASDLIQNQEDQTSDTNPADDDNNFHKEPPTQTISDKDSLSQNTETPVEIPSSPTISCRHSSSSLKQYCSAAQGSEDDEPLITAPSTLLPPPPPPPPPVPPPPPPLSRISNHGGTLLESVTTADTSAMSSNADSGIFIGTASDSRKNDLITAATPTSIPALQEVSVNSFEDILHEAGGGSGLSSRKPIQRYKIDQIRRLRYLPASNRRPKTLNELVDKSKVPPKRLIMDAAKQPENGISNTEIHSQLDFLESSTGSNKNSVSQPVAAALLRKHLYNMCPAANSQQNNQGGVNTTLNRAVATGMSNFASTPKCSLGAADAPPFVPRHGYNNLLPSDYDEGGNYGFSKENSKPSPNQWKYSIDQDPAVSQYAVSLNQPRTVLESTQHHHGASYHNHAVAGHLRRYHDLNSGGTAAGSFSNPFNGAATAMNSASSSPQTDEFTVNYNNNQQHHHSHLTPTAPNFPSSTIGSSSRNSQLWNNPLLWLKSEGENAAIGKQHKYHSENESHQYMDSGKSRILNQSEMFEVLENEEQQPIEDLWDAPGRVPYNLNTSPPSLAKESQSQPSGEPLSPGIDVEPSVYEKKYSEESNLANNNYFSSGNSLLNAEQPFIFFEEEGGTEGSMFLKHIFNKTPQLARLPAKESSRQLTYNNVGTQQTKMENQNSINVNNSGALRLLLQTAGLNSSMSAEHQRALKAKLAAILNSERSAKATELNHYAKPRSTSGASYLKYHDEDRASQAYEAATGASAFGNSMQNPHHFLMRPTVQQQQSNPVNNAFNPRGGTAHVSVTGQNQPGATGRSPRTQQFNAIMTALIHALRPQMYSSQTGGNAPSPSAQLQQPNVKLTSSQQQAFRQLLEYYKQHKGAVSQTALIDILKQQLRPSSVPSATSASYSNLASSLGPTANISERTGTKPGYYPHGMTSKSRPYDGMSHGIGTPGHPLGCMNEAVGFTNKLDGDTEGYGNGSISSTGGLLRNPGGGGASPGAMVMSPSKEVLNGKRVPTSSGTSAEELQRFLKMLQQQPQPTTNEAQTSQHSMLMQNGIQQQQQQHRGGGGFSLDQLLQKFKISSNRESPPQTPHNFSQFLQNVGSIQAPEKLSGFQLQQQQQQKLFERQQQQQQLMDGSMLQSMTQPHSFCPNTPESPTIQQESVKHQQQKLFERQQQKLFERQQQKLFERQQQQQLHSKKQQQPIDDSLLQSMSHSYVDCPAIPDSSPNIQKEQTKYQQQQRLLMNQQQQQQFLLSQQQQQQFLLSQQQQQIQKLLNQSSGFNANAGIFIPRMDLVGGSGGGGAAAGTATGVNNNSSSLLEVGSGTSDNSKLVSGGDFLKERITDRTIDSATDTVAEKM